MNPNGSADRSGWMDGNGSHERRNGWGMEPPYPQPMMQPNYRNEGAYNNHQSPPFWAGPWMGRRCPRPNYNNVQHSQPMSQQVFMQHQPFAGAYAFPPAAHIPRHFHFGTRRGSGGRSHNHHRQFPHHGGNNSHDWDVSGSNVAVSGHQRSSDQRAKCASGGAKGKRKHQWRRKASRAGASSSSTRNAKGEKSLEESESLHEQVGMRDQSGSPNFVNNGSGEIDDSSSLCSRLNVFPDNSSNDRKTTAMKTVSNICDRPNNNDSAICKTKKHVSSPCRSSLYNDNKDGVSREAFLGEDESQQHLVEDGAVGGVDVMVSGERRSNPVDPVGFQSDKDLIDEGAICDFDGLFQNQEYLKDNDEDSLCDNEEEDHSDSIRCYNGGVMSDDSESENGAYGGLASACQLPLHSPRHNGVYSAKDRGSKSSVLRCNGNSESGNLRLQVYDNQAEWRKSKDDRNFNGDGYHLVTNGSDSCGEDNGDFIDADLPSSNKHILSSSDEMEHLSSDDGCERQERTAPSQSSISPPLFRLESGDSSRNDLSTVVQHKLEHLKLRGDNSMKRNGLSGNQYKSHGISNCDSKSENKNLFYSKQTKYLSENSDSDCENDDVSHTFNETAMHSHQTHSRDPVVVNNGGHLPVIGAAASALSPGQKVVADHPGADGGGFPSSSSASHSQCFHSEARRGVCNPALSASSEQWAIPSSHVHNPASGPSFVEGSASCGHNPFADPINDLSALYHGNNGHLANGLCADTAGANFINDESNQHQKVFSKKSLGEKLGTEASHSASSMDDNEVGTGSNLPDSSGVVENRNHFAEELLTLDSVDSVDMVLLPMEEEIEPVHFMAGFCPSAGSGSGDEDEMGHSTGFHPATFLSNNVHAVSSSFSCDECHCAHKDLTPKLTNRLPSKEFYELIKSVSASESCMRFFDKDGKDIQRSNFNVKTADDDGGETTNQQTGSSSKSDRLKVDRVMIWNEYEAYVVQFKQIAVSACGQTAVLNVLKALKFNTDKAAVCKVIKTSLRKEDKDIPEYLFSRACAGTTATELKDGVERLSGGAVGGRFFHFWPPRKVRLLHWLAYWMKRGAIPMATMNLQKGPHDTWDIPDSWHHQMVYGVSDQGLNLTNPLEIVSERSAMRQLCSDSVLLVRRQDVVSRFQETTELSQLLDHPDPRWLSMNVLGQVVNVLRECNMPSVPGYRLQVTSHVTIPASYQAGIMLFMRKDKEAWSNLMTAPELPLADGPLSTA